MGKKKGKGAGRRTTPLSKIMPGKQGANADEYLPGTVSAEVKECIAKARVWLEAKEAAAEAAEAAKVDKEEVIATMASYGLKELIVDGRIKLTLENGLKCVKYNPKKEAKKKDAEHDATKAELAETVR